MASYDDSDNPNHYPFLKDRLIATISVSILSIVSSSMMFYAYLIYRRHLRSLYNDLYVIGTGGFLFLQCLQRFIFGVVHLYQFRTFSGPSCIASAALDQFLNFGSQLCFLGFFVSLLTMRGGSLVIQCCGQNWKDSRSLRGSLPPLPESNKRLVSHSLMGEEDDQQLVPSKSGAGTTSLLDPESSDQIVAGVYASVPPMTRSGSSNQTVVASPGSEPLFFNRTGQIWFLAAVVGGVVSTVVMCIIVIHDPDAQPVPGLTDPQNFEAGLGWCWIPKNHELLRFLCSYMISGLSGITTLILFAKFFYYEYGSSMRTHSMVYTRLIGAFVYGAVSATLEGYAQDAPDDHPLKVVATTVVAFFGMVLTVLFLWTERVTLALLRGSADIPGDGFSKSLNHLMLMEVAGVNVPASGEPTQCRFTSSSVNFLSQGGNGNHAADHSDRRSCLLPPEGWNADGGSHVSFLSSYPYGGGGGVGAPHTVDPSRRESLNTVARGYGTS